MTDKTKRDTHKTRCNVCRWQGRESDLLQAPSPFDSHTIYACPKCKSIDHLIIVCDEPGCWADVTAGTPTPTGYRQTCGQHRPEATQ